MGFWEDLGRALGVGAPTPKKGNGGGTNTNAYASDKATKAANKQVPAPVRGGATTGTSGQRDSQQPVTKGVWSSGGGQTTGTRGADSRPEPEPTVVTPEQRSRDEATAKANYTAALSNGRTTYTPQEMSWDDYNALSPQQRAAVDANTALVTAMRDDAATRASGATGDGDYKKNAELLFGSSGDGGQYSPETIALLSKLGVENGATHSSSLSNYLDNSALVDSESLKTADKQWGFGNGAEQPTTRQARATLISQSAQSLLTSTLAKGQNLLDLAKGQHGFNTATDPNAQALSEMFDFYANKSTADTVTPDGRARDLEYLGSLGIDKSTVQKYFDQRLQNYRYASAADPAAKLGSDAAAEYISPDDFVARYYETGA